MPKQWIITEKQVGQTPLEATEKLRVETPELKDMKLAYAGRLDPMASGKLLVLVGDECKKQEQYHGLDKAYEVEVVFDISSDSGDVLGLVKAHTTSNHSEKKIIKTIETFRGPFAPPYPIFSSKPVHGKPLHTWALEGRLDEIEVPLQSGHVYRIVIKNIHTVTSRELYTCALSKINSMAAVTDERKALGQDFRRTPIRASWENFLAQHPNRSFQVVAIQCICSSGTYMRSLAEEIGKALDTQALALSIHRTHIGTYQPLPFGAGFWKLEY